MKYYHLCGGNWSDLATHCRTVKHYGGTPSLRFNRVGFRLIKKIKTMNYYFKGGSWTGLDSGCCTTSFSFRSSHHHYTFLGFRLIKKLKS